MMFGRSDRTFRPAVTGSVPSRARGLAGVSARAEDQRTGGRTEPCHSSTGGSSEAATGGGGSCGGWLRRGGACRGGCWSRAIAACIVRLDVVTVPGCEVVLEGGHPLGSTL